MWSGRGKMCNHNRPAAYSMQEELNSSWLDPRLSSSDVLEVANIADGGVSNPPITQLRPAPSIWDISHLHRQDPGRMPSLNPQPRESSA